MDGKRFSALTTSHMGKQQTVTETAIEAAAAYLKKEEAKINNMFRADKVEWALERFDELFKDKHIISQENYEFCISGIKKYTGNSRDHFLTPTNDEVDEWYRKEYEFLEQKVIRRKEVSPHIKRLLLDHYMSNLTGSHLRNSKVVEKLTNGQFRGIVPKPINTELIEDMIYCLRICYEKTLSYPESTINCMPENITSHIFGSKFYSRDFKLILSTFYPKAQQAKLMERADSWGNLIEGWESLKAKHRCGDALQKFLLLAKREGIPSIMKNAGKVKLPYDHELTLQAIMKSRKQFNSRAQVKYDLAKVFDHAPS